MPKSRRKIYSSFEEFIEGRFSVNERGCFVWNPKGGPGGYAQTTFNGSRRLVHRVSAYFCLGLDLDDVSSVVDHKCKNKRCCNPKHLSVGTQKENVLAENSSCVAKKRSEKICCPKCGGPYKTYSPKWLKGNLVRRCVPCDTEYKRLWANRKAA